MITHLTILGNTFVPLFKLYLFMYLMYLINVFQNVSLASYVQPAFTASKEKQRKLETWEQEGCCQKIQGSKEEEIKYDR